MQIDDAFQQLVNRRQRIGQRHEVRLLDEVGRFRRHAERLLWLVVGDVAAPGDRLAIEVVEVLEVASGQEVVLDVSKGALDPAFSIGVAHPVGAESEAKGAGEGQHLRGDDGIGAGAGGEQDAGIVDDADRADAIHEASRLEQECFGLEAGEPRVVLNEQPARVGQHQPGALDGDDACRASPLWRRVTRCGEVSCCISCPGAKSYSPARRGGLRRPASLTQRVKVL